MPDRKAYQDVTKGGLTSSHLQSSFELLQMDLMGPLQVKSLESRRYVLVCFDDLSRYTWVELLREKFDAFPTFEIFCLHLKHENVEEIGKTIRICSDHGREFENSS